MELVQYRMTVGKKIKKGMLVVQIQHHKFTSVKGFL